MVDDPAVGHIGEKSCCAVRTGRLSHFRRSSEEWEQNAGQRMLPMLPVRAERPEEDLDVSSSDTQRERLVCDAYRGHAFRATALLGDVVRPGGRLPSPFVVMSTRSVGSPDQDQPVNGLDPGGALVRICSDAVVRSGAIGQVRGWRSLGLAVWHSRDLAGGGDQVAVQPWHAEVAAQFRGGAGSAEVERCDPRDPAERGRFCLE
jgi:hypothetical protein